MGSEMCIRDRCVCVCVNMCECVSHREGAAAAEWPTELYRTKRTISARIAGRDSQAA